MILATNVSERRPEFIVNERPFFTFPLGFEINEVLTGGWALRMVSRKLSIAVLTVAVLVELQIYAHKFNRNDMFGYYLRRLVDSKQAMRPAPVLPANTVREITPLTH